MICIYCRRESAGSRGVPHVFPEAFGQNPLVLPVGSVCDACNNYLGHELDNVFVAHPVLSLLSQFLRFPGKGGKLRKQLGNVELDVYPRSVTIPCTKPRTTIHPDGSRSVTAEPLIDPRFDFLRFRRALHHIAFNAYALKRGAEEALAPRFDRVRKYVRTPQKGESWAFAQYCDLMGNFKQDVTIVLNSHDSSEFVGIAVGGAMAFGVDLLSSGDLSSWVEQEFPPGTLILGPDHRVPRAQRPPRDGAKHRVTIYLEA